MNERTEKEMYRNRKMKRQQAAKEKKKRQKGKKSHACERNRMNKETIKDPTTLYKNVNFRSLLTFE